MSYEVATFDQAGHPIDVGGRGTTDVTLGGADPVSFGVDGPSAQVGVAGGLSVTVPIDSSPVPE